MPDGYEYQSARDLNDDEYEEPNTYLPYPGKRPYPNPLVRRRRHGLRRRRLPLEVEYRLSKAYGTAPAGALPRDDYRLLYSDGEQYSLSTALRRHRAPRAEPARRLYAKQARSSWTG